MQTYSHAIIAAAVQKKFGGNAMTNSDRIATVAGAFAPDVPLILLTTGLFVQRLVFSSNPTESLFGPEFNHLYFTNPFWISGHNLFHAPLLIALYLLLGYWWGIRGEKRWAIALFWFAVGCASHSLVDIVTHYNDGPLLLFPFDWHTRFTSPISYWDPNHGGQLFRPLEHILDALLLIYLLWWRKPTDRGDAKSARDDND